MPWHHKDILDEWHECETDIESFDRRLGSFITSKVATMACAYVFAAIAFISLPSAIATHSLLAIVSWVAQTFLQLVLLAIILYGQNLASEAADARSEATFRNTQDAEKKFGDVLGAIAQRGEENARMEKQNNAILERLNAKEEE